MKFAAIALIASVSAVKVQGNCVNKKESRAIFEALDSNGNGVVGGRELKRGLEAFAKSRDYTITDADKEWVTKTAKAAAGGDNTLTSFEFHKWVNEFAKHYHIDGCN